MRYYALYLVDLSVLTSQFSNESILNCLLLFTVHSTTPALNTCHLYLLTLHRVSFALHFSPNLVSTLLLPLVVFTLLANLFPPTSFEIYQLLHCLQIQSKNSPFLWCKQFWRLTILSTCFWFDIIMLILASWNYFMLSYIMKYFNFGMKATYDLVNKFDSQKLKMIEFETKWISLHQSLVKNEGYLYF